MMRVFIDADVILDLLLAREPFFPGATRLFLLVQDGEVEGFVSPLIFSNLFYVLRKKFLEPGSPRGIAQAAAAHSCSSG
jgi:predicted nucleic acid-binding protein